MRLIFTWPAPLAGFGHAVNRGYVIPSRVGYPFLKGGVSPTACTPAQMYRRWKATGRDASIQCGSAETRYPQHIMYAKEGWRRPFAAKRFSVLHHVSRLTDSCHGQCERLLEAARGKCERMGRQCCQIFSLHMRADRAAVES